MILIFDTETTGLPRNFNAPISDSDNWPRMVQIAWQLHEKTGKLVSTGNSLIIPEGFSIPFNSEKIHGISTERAQKDGKDLKKVLQEFEQDLQKASIVAGHNIEFDIKVLGAEFFRKETHSTLFDKEVLDTKDLSTEYCALPGGKGGRFKWPTLTELHTKLFGEAFDSAHDAAYDVHATAKCFFGMVKKGLIPALESHKSKVEYEAPELGKDNFSEKEIQKEEIGTDPKSESSGPINPCIHLHNHSQFSILQASTSISNLIDKAKSYEMPAIALTDLGNMFGAFQFVRESLKQGIKPIMGCELIVAEERKKKQFTRDDPDKRFRQVLLAKNLNGYRNLTKLSSIGYMEGYYSGFPRIDLDLIEKYHKDLIALSGGLQGELPYLILNVGKEVAEKRLQWWHKLFGEDFYLEINRHGLEEEKRVNEVLMEWAEKYDIKIIASCESYYSNREDSEFHDILLCVKEGELKNTPIGKGRGFRPGFEGTEYFLKSPREMNELFSDIPQALKNTIELAEKIESYELQRDVVLPNFTIPKEFEEKEDQKDNGKRGENKYLRHLTFEGAKKRYDSLSDKVKERLDFELKTIERTGYPGYFLIVQDFTNKSREMGVTVGPGRGSAAGSAVAYCTGITNVDPIKYDLLFERFLNPDRISLPDIDIDFDDEGRAKVLDYVVNKYGFNQVAQIITYGTMAAKSSIRDTGRVLNLPLSEADRLAKLVPDISLKELFTLKPGDLKEKLNGSQLVRAEELKKILAGDDLSATTLRQAAKLEGTVRNTGTHACGVIITPEDITNLIPASIAKDSDLLVTQFDNSVVESAGMLKMDFLGLKTLTIINEALRIIEEKHGTRIDPDEIPLDDEKTYELYQKGLTNGTFQFESPGMQRYLRSLKPDKFRDLIAMNALYRPGPMEYIPNFIRRKHGEETIKYDLPEMEEFLEETYGITVYQEQVMLLAQKLAGFSKGEADLLRKGMGKKKREILDELKPKYLEGCKERGHSGEVAEKIWKDWEAFAAYAFNKSHSTCYSVIAYQTAYLKANYPAEYMAAVLTHNMNDIKKVTFFMDECRNLGIPVLGPHVNESSKNFDVNEKGKIRFGLGAIKGTGDAAVMEVIEVRGEKGPFKNVFDFASRINLRQVTKKTFEALAMAGAFDCFEGYHRRQYLEGVEGQPTLLDMAIKYGQKHQDEANSSQAMLFGAGQKNGIELPAVKSQEPFGQIEKLKIEKEVVGFYISGHPLDQFNLELEQFCTHNIHDLPARKTAEISVGGMVTNVRIGQTKRGLPYGVLTLEDKTGSTSLFVSGDDYLKNSGYFRVGEFLYVKGKMGLNWRKEMELKTNPNAPVLDSDWEFKPIGFYVLSEIKKNMTKGIQITLNSSRIDEILIGELVDLLEKNKGKFSVKIKLKEEAKNWDINFLCRKSKVNLDSGILSALEEMEGLSFKLLL
jgi:DNA polymerase III subunit alpha